MRPDTDSGKKRPGVLIVDAVPDNLHILGTELKQFGYDITIATDGKIALSLVNSVNPDVILLDAVLPGMDGYELCRELKNRDYSKDIPVIFLTGKSSADDVIKGFETGAADYIIKPFNVQEVIARIKTHIALKTQRDMAARYISQLHEVNEKLNKKEKELIEIDAGKDKLFSIIAHDLKNPFQGFIGLTDLLISEFDGFSIDEIRDIIKEINKSATRLNKLLENLLTWSRLQIGRIPFEPAKFHLKDLADESLKIFMGLAGEKNISLKNRVPDDALVFADKFMIDTVVRNLLSNAVKFTDGFGEVILEAREMQQFTILNIRDTGIGMSPDDISKIFRMDIDFTKLGTRNESGTGLGLILCKDLVEKNNGIIEVTSAPGSGTTFSVYLPNKDE